MYIRRVGEMLSELKETDPKKFGGFTLIGRLGQGGMGTIYLAHHGKIGTVALKVLHEEHASNAAMRKRFAKEVDAFSAVEVTGVPRVIAQNMSAPRPFFAMEFVSGANLLQTVKTSGPLSEERVVHLGKELARIVGEMHNVGVIHGDVNPSNILITPEGPYLIDFGIASFAGDDSSIDGLEYGSPEWLAPELHAGGRRTSAVDVFGWATTICFATSGKVGDDGSWNFVDAGEDGEHCPELWTLPESIRDVTCAALAHDPIARPAASDIMHILNDQAARDLNQTVDAFLGLHAETQPVGGERHAWRPPAYRPKNAIAGAQNVVMRQERRRKMRRTAMFAAGVPLVIVLAAFASQSNAFAKSSDGIKKTEIFQQVLPTTTTSTTTTTTIPDEAEESGVTWYVGDGKGNWRPATAEEIAQRKRG